MTGLMPLSNCVTSCWGRSLTNSGGEWWDLLYSLLPGGKKLVARLLLRFHVGAAVSSPLHRFVIATFLFFCVWSIYILTSRTSSHVLPRGIIAPKSRELVDVYCIFTCLKLYECSASCCYAAHQAFSSPEREPLLVWSLQDVFIPPVC